MFDPAHVHATLPLRFLAVAALSCVASCSAAPSPEAPEEGASAATQEAATSASPTGGGLRLCPATSGALVLSPVTAGATPACPPVSGKGGAWRAHPASAPTVCNPLVETASEAVLCVYDWSASRRNAAPDLAALQALAGVYVTSFGDTGSKACNDDAMLRFASLMSAAEVTCPRTAGGGPNAPKGCDVCGRGMSPGVVRNQLVLAPSTPLHTLVVTLSNGTKQVLTIAANGAGGGRSCHSLVDVPLPAPPRGVSYVSGPAPGYGYDAPAP